MKIRMMNRKNKNHKEYNDTNRGMSRKMCRKRRVAKSELRYRIVENTMRGYFNYSV